MTKTANMTNLLAKSVLAGLLAFSAGTGTVLASGDTTQSNAIASNETSVSATTAQSPSLLPGDILYFVKTMYENIQLALTSNDVKKAKLLAEFAHERLSETNALLAQGKTELAKQALQKSLEVQELAVKQTDQASGVSTATVEPAAAPADATAATTATTTTASTPVETSTVQASVQQPVSTEQLDPEKETEALEEVKNPEQVLKLKTDLQHNIIALSSALKKAENPQAQMALMKNIEKSFAHLEKRLSKLENKEALKQQNAATAEEAPVPTPAPVQETQTTNAAANESVQPNAKPDLAVTEAEDKAELKMHKEKAEIEIEQHEKMEKPEKRERTEKPEREKESKHGNHANGKERYKENN